MSDYDSWRCGAEADSLCLCKEVLEKSPVEFGHGDRNYKCPTNEANGKDERSNEDDDEYPEAGFAKYIGRVVGFDETDRVL